MTKLNRVTGKVFGGDATATGDNPEIGQFGSALAGTYNGTTDVATIQNLPAWGQGWAGAVTPDTNFPALPEMTGFGKVLSYQNNYVLQSGVPEYDSGTIYYINDFCRVGDILYYSLTDNNQGNDPTTDITNWASYNSKIFADNTTDTVLKTKGLVFGTATAGSTSSAVNIPCILPAGTEVLIPNGREDNGKLKNLDITITEDINSTFSGVPIGYSYSVCLQRLSSDSAWYLQSYIGSNFYTVDTLSGSQSLVDSLKDKSEAIFYCVSTNKWYYSPATAAVGDTRTIQEIDAVRVGSFRVPVVGSTPWNYTNYPNKILTFNDHSWIGRTSYPAGYAFNYTLGASGTKYYAPTTGFFFCNFNYYNLTSGASNYVAIETAFLKAQSFSTTYPIATVRAYLPIQRNATCTVSYRSTPDAGSAYVRFVPAVGSFWN